MRYLQPFVLCLLAVASACSGIVCADEIVVQQPGSTTIATMTTPPLIVSGSGVVLAPTYVNDAIAPQEIRNPYRPVRDWMRRLPWACASDHNSLGSSNFLAEGTFVFGSSRDFYGDPCFKSQPTVRTPVLALFGINRQRCNCEK
jgi:hypothetical protein